MTAPTFPGAPEVDGLGTGHVVDDRHVLERRLGRGSFGEVWAAYDRLLRRPVAIKILHAHVDLSPALVRLEVAALRLRLPGVVELIDDGVWQDRVFLVMELVHGRPFPGAAGARSWEEIAPITVALLQTLARVHGAFMVHRDLKPENVLVTPHGQVRLLDFGIAYRLASGSIDADAGQSPAEILGTPVYMAPEQIQAGAITERTDLYALGVMLYQALSGKTPHDSVNMQRLMYAKIHIRPPPLCKVAPQVPENVARLVDAMLEREPQKRPQSAFQILTELRGDASVEEPVLPWIGPQTTITRVLSAAREGRSIDIMGPRGSGRTRHLLAVEQQLSPTRPVVWVRPAEEALESLGALCDPADLAASATLAEAVSRAEASLRRALSAGTLILADDFPRLDAWSRQALERARDAGVVIRVLDRPHDGGGPSVRLGPLAEADLQSLFVGPDRLLHLREDAARILFQRTEGWPSRVVREVSTWLHLGIARWHRNLVAVSRESLDRLALGLMAGAPAEPDAEELHGLSALGRDLLVWITLAWPHSSIELLSRMTGSPVYRTSALALTLCEAGVAVELSDRRLAPTVPAPITAWPEERVRRAHAAIAGALQPGQRSRFLHLVAAGRRSRDPQRAVAEEALAQANRLIGEGHLGEAVAAIEAGLRAARTLGDHGERAGLALLAVWVEAAVEDGSPHALDRVLYALCRWQPAPPQVALLERLVRAMADEGLRGRALDLIREVPPFDDIRLERVRLGAFAAAARKLGDGAMEERLLDEIARSPAVLDEEIAARLAYWRGRVLYLRGDFLEAARLHAEAARRSTSVPMRMAAMTAGANSLLDAFDLDQAQELAEQARALAARHRHASHEAEAEWVLRTILYRRAAPALPDVELIQAIPHATGRVFEGAVLFNEAAIAWRAGRDDQALDLARRGLERLSQIGARRGPLLLRAFLVMLGEPASPDEIAEMCELARASGVPGIGVQALALLARAGKLPRDAVGEAEVNRLAALVPVESWRRRYDILSVEECLDAIRAAA